MKVEPFLLFIVDEDKAEFAVLGPLDDDRPWINRVDAARKAGRNVRLFTAHTAPDKDVQAAGFARDFNLRYVSKVPV